ncbi:lipid II flippase MurJ [Pseudonocardia sp. WMMC193]|uniref:lipid II flippase MurJ n=1 Tax=Pseudonocardia sp. WMMC193 TaxID=2911965 RepID=UPI001F17A590|nr:lipid II flippase MurJ [Pseudonocardia sp. WMMC193]MCF7552716.1 polysaccharide biosynthesis C-terminal domain-containing protein [Pseudonocardia sp. WMMC193]
MSRATGFARTSVWAAALGLFTVGSAYTVANTLPTVLFSLVAGGMLSAVLVPQLVRAQARGPEQGQAYADRLLSLTVVVLLPATGVAVLGSAVLVRVYAGDGWSVSDLALATALAVWCLPQILFYGVYSVLGQILHARDRPGPMLWAPVANNVLALAVGVWVLWAGGIDTGPGPAAASSVSPADVAVIGGGSTAGVVVQVLVLIPALRAAGLRYRPRLDLRGSGLGAAARLAGWTLLFVAANQVAFAVTAAAMGTAGATAVTAGAEWAAGMPTYVNANMIMLVPHAVIAVSISTAALPGMSRAAAAGRPDLVGASLVGQLTRAAQLLVPFVVLLLVAGPALARLLFPGNPAPDGWYLGVVVGAFSPAVLLYSAQFILARGLHALEDTRSPALVQVAVAAAQSTTAVSSLLVLPAEWVVAGAAGGFCVAYAIGAGLTARTVRRRTGTDVLRAVAPCHLRDLAAAVLAGAVAVGSVGPLPAPAGLVEALLSGTTTVAVYAVVLACVQRLATVISRPLTRAE